MKFRGDASGFALPTVVIASLVLMIVLVAGLSAATSTSASIQAQYYDELTREASEAGATFAQACLEANNYSPQWTNAKPLTPSTDCSGNVLANCASTCYVYSDTKIKLSFRVNLPTTTADGYQLIQSSGSVSQLRASNGATWNTISQTINAKVGATISAQSIVFGDSQYTPVGSFYGVVGGDGIFRTAGLNANGQLGQGVAAGTTVTIPGQFLTPGSTSPIVKGFANNLSLGSALFAVNANGQAYAAGSNNHGQLGVGISYSGNVATPALVSIAGKQISTIATLGDANGTVTPASYFITTDGYVYSSGQCNAVDLLGYSCAADQWTPQLVSGLPTPNINDLNTIPSDNIVTDSGTVYVRMQGGRVYGWGSGNYGQLGSFTRLNSVTPVKIGTYGDAGQPKAKNIQFDGQTLYVLDDGGNLSSVGWNKYGQMGNRTSYVYMDWSNGKCITFYGGTAPQLQTCLGTADQRLKFGSDNSISNLGGCLTINADNTWLSITQCVGGANQQFVIDNNNERLSNPATGKCLDNYYGDGQALWMTTCAVGNLNQHFDRYNPNPTPFNMTGITGSVTMISADQWSVSAVANGQVWSSGVNYNGMFGSGLGLVDWVPDPVKFDLSAYGSPKVTSVINTVGNGSEIYVIANDGRVYGAGANTYGQLGNCTTSTYSLTPIQMKLLVPLNGSYTPCTVNANAIEDLNPVQVIAGGGTTVVRMATNRVFSVGNNSNGQLGDGTTTNSAEPKVRLYLNPAKPLSY